jgi:hypothetical protein
MQRASIPPPYTLRAGQQKSQARPVILAKAGGKEKKTANTGYKPEKQQDAAACF